MRVVWAAQAFNDAGDPIETPDLRLTIQAPTGGDAAAIQHEFEYLCADAARHKDFMSALVAVFASG